VLHVLLSIILLFELVCLQIDVRCKFMRVACFGVVDCPNEFLCGSVVKCSWIQYSYDVKLPFKKVTGCGIFCFFVGLTQMWFQVHSGCYTVCATARPLQWIHSTTHSDEVPVIVVL
jgi:hypothetical protein